MENAKPSILNSLEGFLKVATPIGAIIAFLIGIYHYKDSKRMEYQKEFWSARYHLYKELTDLTGQLSNTSDTTLHFSLSHDFWVLYWGNSILLEDKHVYHAMQSFGASLDKAILPDSLITLRKKSLEVGHACRLSLKETWEPIPMKELEAMNK